MMGKYAFYILAAYGVSALAIAGMIADTWLRARRWRAEVRRLEQVLGKTGTQP
jgi:heme exporter protein CcmD